MKNSMDPRMENRTPIPKQMANPLMRVSQLRLLESTTCSRRNRKFEAMERHRGRKEWRKGDEQETETCESIIRRGLQKSKTGEETKRK